MIRIEPKIEYVGFDASVRQPGKAFLSGIPKPNNEQFKKGTFWTRALRELYSAYAGVCAYTAVHVMQDGVSVDHFKPKSKYPDLAYEWSNFRLASKKVNGDKKDHEIIDPCEIEEGWFVIEFPSCVIKAGENLDKQLKNRIKETIQILKLNTYDPYVQRRCDLLVDYAKGDITLNFLKRYAPFVAYELERQDMVERIKQIILRTLN